MWFQGPQVHSVRGFPKRSSPVVSVEGAGGHLKDDGASSSASSGCASSANHINALETDRTLEWGEIEAAIQERLQQQQEFPLAAILARIQARKEVAQKTSTIMYFPGRLNSVDVRFFIDTGAEGSFVSEALVREKQLPLHRGKTLVVRGAFGAKYECKNVLDNISLNISE